MSVLCAGGCGTRVAEDPIENIGGLYPMPLIMKDEQGTRVCIDCCNAVLNRTFGGRGNKE
jgi:hypothetical protein